MCQIDETTVLRKKIIEKTGIKFTTLVGVINAFQEKTNIDRTTGYDRNQVKQLKCRVIKR